MHEIIGIKLGYFSQSKYTHVHKDPNQEIHYCAPADPWQPFQNLLPLPRAATILTCETCIYLVLNFM